MSNNETKNQKCAVECDCGCDKSCETGDKTLIRDILKIVIMGSQSIDVTREYVESEGFQSYLCELQSTYQELIKETENIMRSKGITEDILSSVREAFTRGMVKMGMMGTHSDEKVAEQLIKGTTMGLETIGNNLNVNGCYSEDIVAHAETVEDTLNQSIKELRKWLV